MKPITSQAILCLTTAALSLSAFAELNNSQNLYADGYGGCKNDGHINEEECKTCGEEKSPGESAANEEANSQKECDDNEVVKSLFGGFGAFVHNGRLEMHVPTMDFVLPSSTPGCGTCGTDTGIGGGGGLASVKVNRHFQSRFTVENSSFGRTSGLAGYDVSLKWKKGWMLSVVNDYNEAGSIMSSKQMNWASDTQTWRPNGAARTAYGLTLFDATGNPITAAASRDLAHTGVLLEANGKSTHFEFICRSDNTVFARPVAFADRNGNLTTVEYIDAQPAFGTTVPTISEYFRRTKITDPYGRELLFEYQLQGSTYLVSKITHPDGQFTTYNYATLSFYGKVLSSVNHPDGSTSTETWTRNTTTGFWATELYNATAPAGDRVVKAFISGNTGKLSNGTTVSTTTGLTRRVDNGAGEMTYANRIDENGKWLYYNGGKSTVELHITGATKGLSEEKSLFSNYGPEELQEDFFAMTTGPESFERKTVKTKTNGNNFRETIRIDAWGRIIITPTRQPVTLSITRSEKPDGTASTYLYNQFDAPILVTDRLGRVTKRDFDIKGNITKVTRGFGTPSASTTEYLYNAQGLVTEKRDPLYDADFPDLHNTRYQYNSNNFPLKIIHSADFAGGTRPETQLTWDGAGRLATTTDPQGRLVTFAYDNRSRHTTTNYADTSTEVTTYGTGTKANLVISRTDRNGNATVYVHDAADRIILTRSAAGLPEEITETCQYLLGTRLKSTCLNRGEKTEYQYDYRNRLIATTRHADANTALTSTLEIDILGRRRSSTDAYGRRTFYLYDQNDRITRTVTETVPNGLGTVPAFSNTSSQTAQQIEREIELTNGEEITLRGIHQVTYTDARDLFLKNLTRNLTPNAPYLISDRLIDAEGQTLTTTDPRGIETLRLYDALGRTLRSFEAITLPEERLTETDYDDASNIIETRMPRHFAEEDENEDPIRAVERYTYTGRNLRATHTVAADHPTLEATQSWTYNLDGTKKTHTDFRGNTDLTLWNICCRRLQAYIDRDGQSTSIQNTDAKGNPVHTATVSADPSTGGTIPADWHDPDDQDTLQETTTRFDGLDRPTHRTAWLQPLGDIEGSCCGGTGEIPIANNTTEGLTTTIQYDENLTDGIGIDQTYAAQITALATRGVTFNANANGYATAVTNPEGETSVTVQDGLGRIVKTINPEGHIQTKRYDEMLPAGALTPTHLTEIPLPGDLLTTVATDALGHESISYTDGAGRTLLMEDAAGFLTGRAYDANSNSLITRDPNGLGQNCTYDNLNRETECADLQEADENTSRTTTYNAHNATLTSTDAEGNTTTHVYDIRDRLSSTEDPNNLTTAYGYDANNYLLTLTDGKGATRSWTYDIRNLRISKTMPGSSGADTCLYTYDALRRLSIKTDQQGDTTKAVFDLAGRLTAREYRNTGTTLESTDTFTYDAASRITESVKGRYAITTQHTYASDSWPLSESFVVDGRTYSSSRTYDEGNRPISHTYPDGKFASYQYDERYLVSTVHYEGQLIVTKTHDPARRLVEESYSNGLSREITFNRFDNLRTSDQVKDGNTLLPALSTAYQYAEDKQITQETYAGTAGTLPNASFTAAYDAGNRLNNWQRPGFPQGTGTTARQSQTWTFDEAGNWSFTVLDGTIQNRIHSPADELNSISGNATTQDTKGNLLEFTHAGIAYELEYDQDNRLHKAIVGSQDVEYRYDAFGRQVIRKQGTNKTALIWWGHSENAEYTHGAGQACIQNDIFCDFRRLNAVCARAVEGSKFEIEWYHKNYLDHVTAVSDDSGDILEYYRYTAYGEKETYSPTGTNLATTAINNPVTWNTRRQDPLTNFYLYKYRNYAPQLGRWLTRDPIGEMGGINQYGFVGNDGVNGFDTLGLERNIRPFAYPHLPQPPEERLGQSFNKWLKEFRERNNNLTDEQYSWVYDNLARGCIGVTCVELSEEPDNKRCYKTREQAEKVAKLNKDAGVCPNPGIYSIQFYNNINKNGKPDVSYGSDGRADLSNWDHSEKPEEINDVGEKVTYVNMDYGFLGADGMMWGADLLYNPDGNRDGKGDIFPDDPVNNHPKYYKRTIAEWEKGFEDFSELVWCYQCCTGTYGK